jgi:hypothetical protein
LARPRIRAAIVGTSARVAGRIMIYLIEKGVRTLIKRVLL